MRIKLPVIFFPVLAALLLFSCNNKKSSKGNLVIIGGGKRPDYIIEKIVQLSGGEDAEIVIVPFASSQPEETALYQKRQFQEYNPKRVDIILKTETSVDSDINLMKFTTATGIFFSGGDQRRLQKILTGTEVLAKIKSIYRNGGLISGTSAGAAVMSKIMITGDELLNKDSTRSFISIQEGNIDTGEGFGFINDAIIDQHFIKRKRYNRLISLVLEHPELLGIGIDESTAIWVKPDSTFEVLGESSVVVLDASGSKNIQTDEDMNISGDRLKMHIMQSGQMYDLRKKSLVR